MYHCYSQNCCWHALWPLYVPCTIITTKKYTLNLWKKKKKKKKKNTFPSLFQILPVLKPVYYFAESKSFLSNSAGQFIIFNSQKTTRHVIKHLCFFVLLFLDVAFLRADVKGLTKEFISIFYCFSPLNNKTWLSIFSSIFFWTACLLGYSFFFLTSSARDDLHIITSTLYT